MTLLAIFRICVVFASVGSTYQLLSIGAISSGVIAALLGVFWIFGQMRRWPWVSHPPFLLLALFAGRMLFSGVAPEWGLVMITLLLCAWDLEFFIRRLNRRQEILNRLAIESRHLRRLFVVVILGLAAGGLTVSSNFEINLVWVTILSISAALGLNFFLANTESK